MNRVLVVDDEPQVRELVRAVLELEGFVVEEGATAAEGLAHAATQPDLVVLDVRLPDLDGLEVCRGLKADARTASVPVLVISGVAVGQDARAASLEAGADGYLAKPFEVRELLAWVRAILRARGAERAAREAEAKYRVLVEQIPAVTYVSGSAFVSPQIESMLGYSPAEWLADPDLWSKRIHPEDKARVQAEFQRAARLLHSCVVANARGILNAEHP